MKINPNFVIISSFNFMLILIAPMFAVIFTFLSRMPIPLDKKSISIFVLMTLLYIGYLLMITFCGTKIGLRSIRYFALISFFVFIASLCFLWNGLISAAMGI